MGCAADARAVAEVELLIGIALLVFWRACNKRSDMKASELAVGDSLAGWRISAVSLNATRNRLEIWVMHLNHTHAVGRTIYVRPDDSVQSVVEQLNERGPVAGRVG
jgi:hypothetical protein